MPSRVRGVRCEQLIIQLIAPVCLAAAVRCKYWLLKANCLTLQAEKRSQVSKAVACGSKYASNTSALPANICKHGNASGNRQEHENEAYDHTIFWFPETSVRFDDMHTIQFRGKKNRLGSHEETWTVASLCLPKKSETLTTRRSARSDFFGWRTDAPCGTRAVTSRDLPYGRCQPDSASFNCKQPKGECCIEAY